MNLSKNGTLEIGLFMRVIVMKYANLWWYAFILTGTGKAQEQAPIHVEWMNVYLHGGGMHPRYFSIRDFFKTLQGLEENSVYAEATKIVRTDPFFYLDQPVQDMGLVRAFPVKPQAEPYAAYVFGRLYNRLGLMIDPHFPRTIHYTFGWNGMLSIKGRHQGARALANALIDELGRLRKSGIFPKLRIIGYSHGGNVALELGAIKHEMTLPFTVDELVLLATPIQESNTHWLTDALFKKIYLFYSTGDYVQATDFLSSYTHSFAHRHFSQRGAYVPSNLTQVQIRFLRYTFAIDAKNTGSHIRTRRTYINPGHVEMFFFGWTAQWYREFFPIKPLPTGLFMPLLQKRITDAQLDGKHLVATIIPEQQHISFAIKGSERVVETPFLTPQQLIDLKHEAWQFEPFNYKRRHKIRLREVSKRAVKVYQQQQPNIRAKKQSCAIEFKSLAQTCRLTSATRVQNQILSSVARAKKASYHPAPMRHTTLK